jgi:hypothetical protein
MMIEHLRGRNAISRPFNRDFVTHSARMPLSPAESEATQSGSHLDFISPVSRNSSTRRKAAVSTDWTINQPAGLTQRQLKTLCFPGLA